MLDKNPPVTHTKNDMYTHTRTHTLSPSVFRWGLFHTVNNIPKLQ